MATGDINDFIGRLQRLFPRNWSGDPADTPNLNTLFGAIGSALSFTYSQLQYLIEQTRIRTATDIWLDLIGQDYFGTMLPRNPGETDSVYQARILANLLLPRGTREDVSNAVELLTGVVPEIVEPWNPSDTGAYNTNVTAYGISHYGSLAMPYQMFVSTSWPLVGVPNIMGYYAGSGWAGGGYNVGSLCYVSPSMYTSDVTATDVYDTIAETMATGTTAWVNVGGIALPSNPTTTLVSVTTDSFTISISP